MEDTKRYLSNLAAQHKRQEVRSATREAYRAARVDRFNQKWQPEARSGDAAVYESLDLTQRRTRDLVRNDPVFKKAKQKLEELVVGTGLQSFADAVDENLETLDDFNDEADFLWSHWAEHEADVEGKLSFWDMERIAFGEMPEQGNTLLLRCQDNRPGRIVPLCYQLLEFEQLDRSLDRPATESDNKIVNGIEIDRHTKRVAGFHLLGAHPHDAHAASGLAGSSEFVAADRIVHCYVPMRPSMTCGISWFNAIVQPGHDMDNYLGNELSAAAIASLLTVIIKEAQRGSGQQGLGDGTDDSDDYGNELVKLGRGVISRIGKDDDVKIVESSRPSRNAEPFIKLLLMFQSMGVGMSYHRLTGDNKQSSYTSIRASHLDDAAMVRPLQGFFGRQVSLRIRREHLLQAAALGRYKRMTARYLQANLWRVARFEVIGPGREQLDPEKETDSALNRIAGGLSNLKIENALRGLHYRQVLRQRAKEIKWIADELGIELQVGSKAKPAEDVKPLDDADDDELLDVDDDEEEA